MVLAVPNVATDVSVNMKALHCTSVLFAPNKTTVCEPEAPPHLSGIVAIHKGDTRIAEQHFKVAALNYQHPIAIQKLIDLWVEQDRWDEVLSVLHFLPVSSQQFMHLAQISISTHPSKTVQLLHIAEEKYPEDLLMKARLLIYAGKYSQAESLLQSTSYLQQQFESQLLLGMSLFYQKKFVEAISVFAPLYYGHRRSTEIAYWYGRSLRYNNETKKSIEPLKWAADSESEWIKVYYQLELASAYASIGDCKNLKTVLQFVRTYPLDTLKTLEVDQWTQSLENTLQQICPICPAINPKNR